MSELFWDEDFRWREQIPMSDEEYGALPVQERVQLQRNLAVFLGAYANRWVQVQNTAVISSGRTLRELLDREREGTVMRIPEKRRKWLLHKKAA